MNLIINGRGNVVQGSQERSGLVGTGYKFTADKEYYPRYVLNGWIFTYEHWESYYMDGVWYDRDHETLIARAGGEELVVSCADKVYLVDGYYYYSEFLRVNYKLLTVEADFLYFPSDSLLYDNSTAATGLLVYRGDQLVY